MRYNIGQRVKAEGKEGTVVSIYITYKTNLYLLDVGGGEFITVDEKDIQEA